MKKINFVLFLFLLGSFMLLMSCANHKTTIKEDSAIRLTNYQQQLLEEGWYIPKESPEGELTKEYGITNRYGQLDNYFDIEIGMGCDVAIKIVNSTTNECIRYVFVPENSSVNIQMIPHGKYYLKFAYGKDWMEYLNEDESLKAKFTSNIVYDKTVDLFDFGEKNSDKVVNYHLSINMKPDSRNSLQTVNISEAEFMQ